MNKRPSSQLYLIVAMVLLLSGCSTPILYKPSADPSSPLLSLPFPRPIETLEGFPRTWPGLMRDPSERGKTRAPKEVFTLRVEPKAGSYFGSECNFFLYFDEKGAKDDFLGWFKKHRDKGRIFYEGDSGERSYLVTYVERPRTSPEGLWRPANRYVQDAVFRLGNLVVRIEAVSEERKPDLLTGSIEYIAGLLQQYFQTGAGPDSKEQ